MPLRIQFLPALLLGLSSVLSVATIASAHPGHAHEAADTGSLGHYLTHPDHVAFMVVLVGAMVVLYAVARRFELVRQPALAHSTKTNRRQRD